MSVPKAAPSLILVKHSQPAVRPELPAAEWGLSDEGRRRCLPLAERLAAYAPQELVSSPEPKARQTARIAADRLELPLRVEAGLHEHERRTAPFAGEAEFAAAVKRFFEQPQALVFGEESARQSLDRFSAAVRRVLAASPGRSLAIVAHGTVISQYVASLQGSDPFPLWRSLGLPSFVVLSLPDLKVVTIVERIE